MDYFYLFAGIILILILIKYKKVEENFQIHLAQPSKCFDCEKQYKDEEKWKAQPSKCFDCERDIIERIGKPSVGFYAQPSKCFDYEKKSI